MGKSLSLLMILVCFLTVQAVWADDMGMAAGMSTPGMSATPMAKPTVSPQKAKKTKKKKTAEVWVCPMGDYSGPKTADGKCPKCGMDLVQKK